MIGRLSFWNKDNVSNEVDCLACRLVSGLGLLGIGAFLLAQSKKRQAKPLENFTMKGLAAAVGVLGVARLADANFLKATAEKPKEQENTSTDHQFFSRR
uniref:GEO09656p1 n=1 Tax=Drosophila melanogaster TaxID=7227 RepID=Q8MZ28_DROME|eukprot:NP_732261.1 uncharacterized protein Dmel_CG31360 [Drosophila melanogaster]